MSKLARMNAVTDLGVYSQSEAPQLNQAAVPAAAPKNFFPMKRGVEQVVRRRPQKKVREEENLDEVSASQSTPMEVAEGRTGEEEESVLIFREESNHPISETPAITENEDEEGDKAKKPKWDGTKSRNLATVIAQCKEGSFWLNTDTSMLSDVWFFPLSLRRSASKGIVTVRCLVIINTSFMVMFEHDYRMMAEEVLRLIYICEKMRHAVYTPEMRYDFETWLQLKRKHFETAENIIRGDESDAAFAEFMFSTETFKFIPRSQTSPLLICFKKIFRHTLIDDVVGGVAKPYYLSDIENRNIEICKQPRGKYSYCIESRILWVERRKESKSVIEEEEDEELPATQPLD